MIGTFIRCDEPGCKREARDTLFSNITSLKRRARFLRWQVGKEKHYCPDHRTVGKKWDEEEEV